MKNVALFLIFSLLAFGLSSCAQRDINTSAARAAYNIPTGYEQVVKSKRKKKAHSRNKVVKIKRKEAKKNSTDAARHRRKSLFF